MKIFGITIKVIDECEHNRINYESDGIYKCESCNKAVAYIDGIIKEVTIDNFMLVDLEREVI